MISSGSRVAPYFITQSQPQKWRRGSPGIETTRKCPRERIGAVCTSQPGPSQYHALPITRQPPWAA
jgi:hypothetical protein